MQLVLLTLDVATMAIAISKMRNYYNSTLITNHHYRCLDLGPEKPLTYYILSPIWKFPRFSQVQSN